jgi:periplasmic nitrate reductase NapD
MPDEVHISSLVVHSRPGQALAVAGRLRSLEGVDIHGGVEQGKLVVTLETQSEVEIVERLTHIQTLEGVLAANLVFHHVEPAQGRG